MKLKQYRVRFILWRKEIYKKHKLKVLGLGYVSSLFANYLTIDSLTISLGLTALFLAFTRK